MYTVETGSFMYGFCFYFDSFIEAIKFMKLVPRKYGHYDVYLCREKKPIYFLDIEVTSSEILQTVRHI